MAILNYTTKIDATKTIGEITKCLVQHGATKIVSDYDGETPIAVSFSMNINGRMIFYSLPANYEGVMKAMDSDRKVPRSACTKDQAIRVSWRIIKDWVEAQMAIVEAQLADVQEVFLPYAITKSGTTLYKHIQENNNLLLEG